MLIIEAMRQTGLQMIALSLVTMISDSQEIDVENVMPMIGAMEMQYLHQQAPAAIAQGLKTKAATVDGPVSAPRGWLVGWCQ